MSIQGECLCGGVQFEVAEVALIGLCHCSICRRAYGGPFAAEALVPAGQFKFTKGADLVKDFRTSEDNSRAFCSVCGSRTPFPALAGKFYLVPAGLFSEDPGVKPSFHMFVGSKAPWWDIADDLPQHLEWIPGFNPADSGSK